MKQQAHNHSDAYIMKTTDDDEREFEAFAREQDPLDIEAATWVVRKHEGLDAQAEAELQAWLDADPRHAEAFAEMDALRGDVQQLPDDDVAALKATLNEGQQSLAVPLPARPDAHPAGRAPRQRRADTRCGQPWWQAWLPRVLTACAAVLVVASTWLVWQYWRQQPGFEQTYVTARSELLRVTLPDAATQGSIMQMDTATRTTARLFRDHREVVLEDGQAMFTVHPDKQRPFHVLTGNMRITVVGTRFSVRHTQSGLEAGQTVVAVEQGHVRVARDAGVEHAPAPDSGEAPLELTAGQMVVADASGHLGPVRNIAPSAVANWREERLSFDQTPLAEAIAEFERYVHTGLVVHDPAVAALPVGGSYSLKEFQRFTESLPKVLPVRLVRHGSVTEVVAGLEAR
jgi:transmembrane sensor